MGWGFVTTSDETSKEPDNDIACVRNSTGRLNGDTPEVIW